MYIYIHMHIYLSAEGRRRSSPVSCCTTCFVHRGVHVSCLKLAVVETDACLTCELLKSNSGFNLGA